MKYYVKEYDDMGRFRSRGRWIDAVVTENADSDFGDEFLLNGVMFLLVRYEGDNGWTFTPASAAHDDKFEDWGVSPTVEGALTALRVVTS